MKEDYGKHHCQDCVYEGVPVESDPCNGCYHRENKDPKLNICCAWRKS